MISLGAYTRKALVSSGWLLGERALTLLSTFLITVILARYLGPKDFGSLNYAIAFVAVLATIPYLGFGGVIVQELLRNPDAHGETMGVVIYTKLGAALVAFFLANLIAQFIVLDQHVQLLILLISFSMLFDVSVGLRTHFEALTESRSVALVASVTSVLGALARLVAVIAAAPLWVFAALVTVQSAMAATSYVALYRRSVAGKSRLSLSVDHARFLFGRSWPLIISAAAATIYLRVDQFLLGQMRGMAIVGVYSIAARLSEVWYFVPYAIVASIFPRLLELREKDRPKYEARMQESIRYLFWLGVAVAVSVTMIADPAIDWLFGSEYQKAGTILAIHVWACPAVFMGILVEKWFVAEDLLKFFISRQVMSAVVNVILNLILIPKFGGVGSAIATVIAYTLAYYISCFTSHRTAQAGLWMTKAMLWPLIHVRRTIIGR